LAKKVKTPPPPRRPVQAPKQRAAERTPAERRTLLYLLIFSAFGLVMVGAAVAFVALAGGGGSGSSAISSKYCVEQSYPGLSPEHLGSPDAKVKYNSFPPSSGPHYQQPAPWGLYPDPIKQPILVHNLEHGGIVIQYGSDVSEDDVKKLQSFYQDDPYGLVVAPLPKLGTKIALTAWNEPVYESGADSGFKDADPGNGYVLTCTRFDSKASGEFRDKRRNKAGERFASVTDMAPNS
jgi:hypothetical protein